MHDLSYHRSLSGQKRSAMTNLHTLSNSSWGRDVVDVKGCLSRYHKNATKTVVPSMCNSLQCDATVSFLTFENIVPHAKKKNPKTPNNQQANQQTKKKNT